MKLHVFACRDDNYGVLVHDETTGATAAIDAPSEAAVRNALTETGWRLSHILVTHQHFDHIEGLAGLKAAFSCQIVAPAKSGKIADLVDIAVKEGDEARVGSLTATVWEMPGHAVDHVTYWFRQQAVFMAGDVLFAMGCGRVFDDQYNPMWTSLARILTLPDETRIYFGHEYTAANARFALSVDGANGPLQTRAEDVHAALSAGKMTIPTTTGLEKATNPFLRVQNPAIRAGLGMKDASDDAVFRELRERKNRF